MSNLFLAYLGLSRFQTCKDSSSFLFQIQANRSSGKIKEFFMVNKHLATSQMYINIGSFRLKFTSHMQELFPSNLEKPLLSCMLAVAVCCIKMESKLEIRG